MYPVGAGRYSSYDRYYSEYSATTSVQPSDTSGQHPPDAPRTPVVETTTWQPQSDDAPNPQTLEDACGAALAAPPVADPALRQNHIHEIPHLRHSRSASGTMDSTYVLRIHEMLEAADRQNFNHVVSWLPHGRAFKIHDEEKFSAECMPRYFKAKIGSFKRWLRAWGFCRMTEGKDRGAWYHRYFVRGVAHLSRNLTRQQMLLAMDDWLPAGQVPDFHSAATSSALSEVPHKAANADADDTQRVKDPKRLRGTILEDVRVMLQDAEEENNQHIVSWLPHGKAFKVYRRKCFQKVVMPRYFKTHKLTHLSDTLRIWGFQRLKKGGPRERGAYYHKYFVRGNAALCRHRSRQKMKEAMAGWSETDLNGNEAPSNTTRGLCETTAPSHTGPEPTEEMRASGPEDQMLLPAQDSDLHPQTNHGLRATQQPGEWSNRPAPAQVLHFDPHRVQGTVPASVPVQAAEQKAHQRQSAFPVSLTGDGKAADAGTYILRIHEMLEDAAKEGKADVVSWQLHGRAFRIHDEQKFISEQLPRYFKAKIGSFKRWLRAWGFCRMTEGRDRGAWYHRYFVRGVTSLCRNMTRQDMLKAMVDWLPAGQVPDFYSTGSGLVFAETAASGKASNPSLAKNPKKLRGTVPENLRAMLYDAETEGNRDIVSWLPHGRAFKVHNKKAFSHRIMHRYFKAAKATYLSDTLRIWGFARLKKGRNRGAYFHRLFVRGRPELTRHLARQQMREAMAGWPLSVEPDLDLPDVDRVIQLGLEQSLKSKEDATAVSVETGPIETSQRTAASMQEDQTRDADAGKKRQRDEGVAAV